MWGGGGLSSHPTPTGPRGQDWRSEPSGGYTAPSVLQVAPCLLSHPFLVLARGSPCGPWAVAPAGGGHRAFFWAGVRLSRPCSCRGCAWGERCPAPLRQSLVVSRRNLRWPCTILARFPCGVACGAITSLGLPAAAESAVGRGRGGLLSGHQLLATGLSGQSCPGQSTPVEPAGFGLLPTGSLETSPLRAAAQPLLGGSLVLLLELLRHPQGLAWPGCGAPRRRCCCCSALAALWLTAFPWPGRGRLPWCSPESGQVSHSRLPCILGGGVPGWPLSWEHLHPSFRAHEQLRIPCDSGSRTVSRGPETLQR